MRVRSVYVGLSGVFLGLMLVGPVALAGDIDDLTPVEEGRKLARRGGRLSDTAYLQVTVEPREATVRAGGAKGRGSVFARVKGPRWQKVTAEAPGYRTLTGYVELTSREVTRVHLRMERISGKITVVTSPPGAYIKLDDADIGRSPVTLAGIAPGVHGLSVESGSFWWSQNVTVDVNRTVVIDLDVREKAAPPPPPPPPAARASTPPPPPRQRSEPAPAASEPEPDAPPPPPPAKAPERTASSSGDQKGKPNCKAVCGRFVRAVSGSESLKSPIRNRCFERCESGELKFSICAWKARVMQDVSVCMGLPEAN